MAREENDIQATFARAMAAFRSGRMAEAERLFRLVLRRHPKNHMALHILGVISLQTGRPERGADLIERSVALFGGDPFAHRNLGYAYGLLNRPLQALESYDLAIALPPDFANAHYNRGATLDTLARYEEALEAYDRAIGIDTAYVEAHNNRANTLNNLHRYREALGSAGRAIALKPDYAEAYVNLGNALVALRRFGDALACFDQAIALNPDFGTAHANRGTALFELNRYDEALVSYKRALALCPLYAGALSEGAVDKSLLLGHVLTTRLTICDWNGLPERVSELGDRISRQQAVSAPFPILLASRSPEVQRQAAEIHCRLQRDVSAPAIAKRERRIPIRLGYFSADFYEHATAFLMAELFENHDRSRFELTAFSFGPQTQDETYRRLTRAFDSFVDVNDRSDSQVAMLARGLEIDIAVDLKGHTAGSRRGIFAHRAAPVQVNYLGYPGTMGADYIDYLIADLTLIPVAEQKHYSEKIAYLPDTYQPNDSKRIIANRQFTRSEAGLPEHGFVYCCFNNSFKIMPETFDGWMRILGQVEGSVLWLLEDNASAVSNLKMEAGARGIDPGRLVFAKRISTPEHLARHRLADLALDTLPYNAHTTASDALWTGLPVLTQRGTTFAGRVASSLLTAIDLPELIAESAGEFELLAVTLAGAPSRLAALRHKLSVNRLTKPLYDIGRFTRNIEAAYAQMIDRHQAGFPPDHIFIAAKQ